MMLSAELFAGCGGLALGMSRAGFRHALMAEFDFDAVSTAQYNRGRAIEHVEHWPIEKTDVRDIEWEPLRGQLAVISGGPPCQPFGIGGKKLGPTDARDMWPEAVRAIREARPECFLFENVRNIAGPKFRDYLEWIIQNLARPESARQNIETYQQHLERLLGDSSAAGYRIAWHVVNAADFGAPQIRHRVLIFGVRQDLQVDPREMPATHSRDRLLWDQYVTGAYWQKHGLPKRPEPHNIRDRRRVAQLKDCREEAEVAAVDYNPRHAGRSRGA